MNEKKALTLIAEGETLQAICDATGAHPGEVTRVARENGYAFNVNAKRFQPVQRQLPAPVERTTTPLDVVPAPTATVAARPVHRDLIDEGKASSVLRVQRAALKAEQALAVLTDLLEQTRRAEAERRAKEEAEAKRLARIAELKAELAALTGKRQGAAVAAVTPRQASTSAQIVRTWAARHGVDCPARGPIPQRVVDAYLADAEGGAA